MSFSTKEIFDKINKRIKNLKSELDELGSFHAPNSPKSYRYNEKRAALKELESLRKELKTH